MSSVQKAKMSMLPSFLSAGPVLGLRITCPRNPEIHRKSAAPTLETLTWEMLTPVSLSTLSGRRLRMSSTSPVTLAAPTVPPPLDTNVILLAEVKGPLISSATW